MATQPVQVPPRVVPQPPTPVPDPGAAPTPPPAPSNMRNTRAVAAYQKKLGDFNRVTMPKWRAAKSAHQRYLIELENYKRAIEQMKKDEEEQKAPAPEKPMGSGITMPTSMMAPTSPQMLMANALMQPPPMQQPPQMGPYFAAELGRA